MMKAVVQYGTETQELAAAWFSTTSSFGLFVTLRRFYWLAIWMHPCQVHWLKRPESFRSSPNLNAYRWPRLQIWLVIDITKQINRLWLHPHTALTVRHYTGITGIPGIFRTGGDSENVARVMCLSARRRAAVVKQRQGSVLGEARPRHKSRTTNHSTWIGICGPIRHYSLGRRGKQRPRKICCLFDLRGHRIYGPWVNFCATLKKVDFKRVVRPELIIYYRYISSVGSHVVHRPLLDRR